MYVVFSSPGPVPLQSQMAAHNAAQEAAEAAAKRQAEKEVQFLKIKIKREKKNSSNNIQLSLWFKTPLFNNSLHFKTGYQWHNLYIFSINIPLF